MVTVEWRLLVRDAQRRIIGEIDDEEELDVRVRHLDVGAWTVTVDASSASAALMQSGEGILFEVGGTVRLSGPTRESDTEHSAEQGGRGLSTYGGVSDAAAIKRTIWPVYNSEITEAGSTQAAAHAVVSGAAETIIRTIIDRNAGPSAMFDRAQPGLALAADSQRGSQLTRQFRFSDLHEALYGVAEAGGIGWDIIQTGEDLQLVFYQPADLTATARFGIGLGNVASYSYQLTPPQVTDMIIGIGGEGTDRRFYRHVRRDELWPGLILEEFADRRDVDPDADPQDENYVDPDQAAQETADERFEEARGLASVSFDPIDTDLLAVGRDYDRGDQVTFETELGPVTDVIREIHYSRTATQGQVITPSIGQEQETPAIYRRVRQIRRDVNHLQTRR